MRFSATTVMIPEYDLDETARLLSEMGYEGVEWRVRRISPEQRDKPYGPWGNVKNDLTPEKLAANPKALIETSKRYNLPVVGLATNVSADQLEDIRLLAEGCAACNAPFFRVGAPNRYPGAGNYNDLFQRAVDAYGKAIAIAHSFGARMVVEIHRGTLTVSASLAHRLVSHFDPTEIGVIYDLSNMTQEGFECAQLGIELLGPYLAHVHAGGHRPIQKEVREDGSVVWGWEGSSLASGLMNYEQCLKDLKTVGYTGYVSLEDFRSLPTVEKLQEGLAYFQSIRARI